jgi:hypothetical protein
VRLKQAGWLLALPGDGARERIVTPNTASTAEMRARIRVAIRLASNAGQTTDTLQRYYARLRDKRRPVPEKLFAEMAQIVPLLRFLVLADDRE